MGTVLAFLLVAVAVVCLVFFAKVWPLLTSCGSMGQSCCQQGVQCKEFLTCEDSRCVTSGPAAPPVAPTPTQPPQPPHPTTQPPTQPPRPAHFGVNPYPASKGSKVIWSYVCGAANITFDDVKSQGINYLVLSFVEVTKNTISQEFSSDKLCADPYDGDTRKMLKSLHDAGVCISVSIGGDTSAGGINWEPGILSDPAEFVNSFEKLRDSFVCPGSSKHIIDGVDFDIETTAGKSRPLYPEFGKSLNACAEEMKRRGFICTVVPGASQLSPACGFSWASSTTGWFNALSNLNESFFDGICIQWYEGGCQNGNSGSCPLTKQGALNYIQALAGKTYSNDDGSHMENPPALGACFTPNVATTKKNYWNTSCGECTFFPESKIVIGQASSPGPYPRIPTAELLQLSIDDSFQGIGFWSLNSSLTNSEYKSVSGQLAKNWRVYPWYKNESCRLCSFV